MAEHIVAIWHLLRLVERTQEDDYIVVTTVPQLQCQMHKSEITFIRAVGVGEQLLLQGKTQRQAAQQLLITYYEEMLL